MSASNTTMATSVGTQQLTHLISLANSGDETAVQRLRDELHGPNSVALSKSVRAVAVRAEESVLEAMYGEMAGDREMMREALNMIREDLGWDEATSLERLLIDRIAICWLSLQAAEISNAKTKQCPLKLAKFKIERIDHAQKRYLAAIKMLATVRKLVLPIRVQINAKVNMDESRCHRRGCGQVIDTLADTTTGTDGNCHGLLSSKS